MEGSGQRRRLEHRAAAARLDEGHAIVPENLAGGADLLVESHQVGTAAEEHMLAVVDSLFGAGMTVGGGAAAEIAAALDHGDCKAAIGPARKPLLSQQCHRQ